MTQEEISVLNFLKRSPESLFARKEIARKAVKRSAYEENPHWADQALAALVAAHEVEVDDSGLYCIRKSDAYR